MLLKKVSVGSALLRIAAVLLLTMLFSNASAASYSDTAGHWAAPAIEKWSEVGALSGYPDGTFQPDRNVTRAELSEILYKLWSRPKADVFFTHPEISEDAWYRESLLSMETYGVTLAHGATLRPDEKLTREEAMYMIGRAMRHEGIGFEEYQDNRTILSTIYGIKDEADIDAKYYAAIDRLYRDGFVTGCPDRTLRPDNLISRAEVLTIIDRLAGMLITAPGDYNAQMGDRLFLTDGNVTVHLTDGPDSSKRYICVYIVGGAASSDAINIIYEGAGQRSISAYVYCATEKADGCTLTGNFKRLGGAFDKFDTRFAAGHGTELFPYLIKTPEQLKLLAGEKDGSNAGYVDRRNYFELVCDLEMGRLTAPIMRDDGEFIYAILDGAGHTVNYNMSGTMASGYVGLFDGFGLGSGCKNLNVSGDVDILLTDSAKGHALFGGIAGYAYNLNGCSSTQTVHITADKDLTDIAVGGLSGTLYRSVIENCSSDAVISIDCGMAPGCSVSVGGIAGDISFTQGLRSTVKDCSSGNKINVKGGYHIMAGGVLGAVITPEDRAAFDGVSLTALPAIKNCMSSAKITASGASFQIDIGGVCGQISCASVSECFAAPQLASSDTSLLNRGAICGSCYEAGYILDCLGDAANIQYSSGAHVGGITGRSRGGSVLRSGVKGASALPTADRIVCKAWNDGSVDSSFDFSGFDTDAVRAALQKTDWDMDKVWTFKNGSLSLQHCGAGK